jgi:hypothetical protein
MRVFFFVNGSMASLLAAILADRARRGGRDAPREEIRQEAGTT